MNCSVIRTARSFVVARFLLVLLLPVSVGCTPAPRQSVVVRPLNDTWGRWGEIPSAAVLIVQYDRGTIYVPHRNPIGQAGWVLICSGPGHVYKTVEAKRRDRPEDLIDVSKGAFSARLDPYGYYQGYLLRAGEAK